MSGHGGDIIQELTTDHREVEELFGKLEAGGAGEDRGDLRDRVIAELVRHSVAEEQYLYPAAREALPGGDGLADREIAEHAEAERVIKDLEGVDPGDPRFDDLLRVLMSDVRAHIAEEERELFPQLRQHCSADRLDELGERIRTAKSVAPTRPHPSSPDRPPLNKLLAPGAGLVDRLRDKLSGRST